MTDKPDNQNEPLTFRAKKEDIKPRKKVRKPIPLKKKILVSCLVLFLLVVLAGFSGIGYIYFKYSKDLPDIRELKDYRPSTITRLYSDNDELIAEFYVEKRILAPLEKIPLQLKQATLAVEDSNFYYHFGIDPKAIFRAFLTNFKAGKVVEGGSTITQQLSKTLFLSREKSMERKIREAILAVRMEFIFTKDEILEMYLNQIYYGHGSYGVEGAARTYFGKTAKDLTLIECAMLAGLPKAPNTYSPYKNSEKAKRRRDHALNRMATEGFISDQEAERAKLVELRLGEVTNMLNKAPYFVEHIRQLIIEKYGSKNLYREGMKIYTTLNINNQIIAQNAIKEKLREADKRYGYRGPLDNIDVKVDMETLTEAIKEINEYGEGEGPHTKDFFKGVVTEVTAEEAHVFLGDSEGIIDIKDIEWARQPNVKYDVRWSKIKSVKQALRKGDVILAKIIGTRDDMKWSLSLEQEPEVEAGLINLDPTTGHIKAMVGGYDFSKSQFNRAVQAVRQPGSAFKPIIYVSALMEGFTPASIVIDSPVIFKEKENTFDKWKPVNFDKKFYGPTSVRTALTHSRNVVTIKLLQEIGIDKAVKLARNLGITSQMENNLSIALGSSGVTLFEMVGAYAAIANMGERIEPEAIRYIKDRNGDIIFIPEIKSKQVIPSGIAYLMTSLLESVVNRGTGAKVRVLNRPVAGKTGTTNNFVDAWFIGYTPDSVTGVWVGNDKDEPLGVNETGTRTAIPIWLQYMQESLKDVPPKNFPPSSEVTFLKINPETGLETSYDDPKGVFEVFLTDNLPEKTKQEVNIMGNSSF